MQHIETSLAEGLAEGRSAAELSRTIRQDLREPERLYRRVRDKNGILQLSKPAKAYHPGAGVYRSSYKNALRLTRTEINVSYAEADFERWQRLDFVIGYEVRLSNNHTCNGHPFTDICDELAGKYPKWFKFTKWHPQCRCVCLAIFDDDPGAGEVRDVPPNFKQWVTDNQTRLDRSIKKGTAPYWQTHLDFGQVSTRRLRAIGDNLIQILMINAVIPTVYYYAEWSCSHSGKEAALDRLRELPPERNSYIDLFRQYGITATNALDTQCMLELYTNHCIPYHCLSCPMAVRLFELLRTLPQSN